MTNLRSAQLLTAITGLFLACQAQAGLELRWTYTFPESSRYAVRLDASDRSTALLELFPTHQSRQRLSSTYAVVEATRSVPPRPSAELPAYLESSSAEFQIFFAPATEYDGNDPVLPILAATRYDTSGTPLATYSNVLDAGRLSDDGSVLVSFASGDLPLREGELPELLDRILWYNAAGQKVASASDALIRPESAVLSGDGSLFVYARGNGDVVGYGTDGVRIFLRENQDAYFAGEPMPVVTPSGHRIAYQLAKKVGEGYPAQPVRVIDRSGTLLSEIATTEQIRHIHLSDDGARVVLLTPDAAKAYKTSDGTLVWTVNAATGYGFTGAAIRASSGPVALVSQGRSDVGGPVDLRIDAVSSVGTSLGSSVATAEPTAHPNSYLRIRGVHLSADGSYLLVVTDRKIRLFTIE